MKNLICRGLQFRDLRTEKLIALDMKKYFSYILSHPMNFMFTLRSFIILNCRLCECNISHSNGLAGGIFMKIYFNLFLPRGEML